MLKQTRIEALATYYKLLRALETCIQRPLRAEDLGVRATHNNVRTACTHYAAYSDTTPRNAAITTALLYAKRAGVLALRVEAYTKIESCAQDIGREARRAYAAIDAIYAELAPADMEAVRVLEAESTTLTFQEYLDACLQPEAVS